MSEYLTEENLFLIREALLSLIKYSRSLKKQPGIAFSEDSTSISVSDNDEEEKKVEHHSKVKGKKKK